MTAYDTIILGAGHNGLVCAGYLAKGGQRVLVLEARHACGGLAASYEFHKGFRACLAQHVGHFPDRIVRDLNLAKHGFSPVHAAPDLIWLSPDGQHIRLAENRLSGVTQAEQRAYNRYSRLMNRFAAMLAPFWLKTVPPIGHNSLSEMLSFAELGLKLRLLGKDDMREFFRVVTLPMHDLMDEFLTHPGLKAMLSWDGLIGSRQAPRSPNNSVIQLLYRSASNTSKSLEVESLISALCESALERSVEIRTAARVVNIQVEPGSQGLRTLGVQLEDGETICAQRVVSSADPKTTFLKLLGAECLEIEFTNRIQRIRDRGLVSKLHLALDGLPSFTGLENPSGRLILAPDMDSIEYAYDHAKYGDLPDLPVLEITIPSLSNSGLAPEGQHVLSANILYTPYQLRDGWNEAARRLLFDRAMDVLESYAPGLRQRVLGHELLTPLDLEARFNTSGGHWHHGDLALDQLIMMRPTYGAAQYRTPIQGLYLCGAGSHPGGDVTGIPGHNAAKEILS